MQTKETLVDRLKEVLTEGKWVTGTNYLNEISEISWQEATQSYQDLNTVALLTFHIHYYIAGVAKVLEGGPLDISDKYSFEAPEIKSEQEWHDLVAKFAKDAKRFIQLVENMPEERLYESFVEEKYGNYHRNIDLMIEHCYYHLGQIRLIKKLVRSQ